MKTRFFVIAVCFVGLLCVANTPLASAGQGSEPVQEAQVEEVASCNSQSCARPVRSYFKANKPVRTVAKGSVCLTKQVACRAACSVKRVGCAALRPVKRLRSRVRSRFACCN